MAIPQTIIDVIKLAKDQETAETAFEQLKAKKVELLNNVALINEQITLQAAAVQAARQALRVAASKI